MLETIAPTLAWGFFILTLLAFTTGVTFQRRNLKSSRFDLEPGWVYSLCGVFAFFALILAWVAEVTVAI